MDRVLTFRKFIAKSPADPFPRYGLAMELRTQGRRDEAAVEFAAIERDFPDYVPAYLLAGTVLSELGRPEDARAVYQRGIAAANRKGDRHALGELTDALAAL